jgi:hypothetical protein
MNNSIIFIDQFRFFNQVFQYASVFISEQPIKVGLCFQKNLFRAKLWKGFAVSDGTFRKSNAAPLWRPLIIISIGSLMVSKRFSKL